VTIPTLTDLRNWAHSLLAIVGVLAVIYGMAVNVIATSDPTLNTKYANYILLIGSIITAVSKGIDSLNNALGTTPAAGPVAAAASPPGAA
jgi:hypothetical protein